MKRILVITMLAIAVSLAPGQAKYQDQAKSNTEQAIKQLDSERIQALVRSDRAALDRIYADGYIGTGTLGRVTTKAQLFSDLKSGDQKFESITTDDVQVRVHGDTAVEIGRATVNGRYKGQALPRNTRFTRVWMKQQGRWQLVAAHSSSIAQQ